jgi:hypothetical protein
MTITLAKNWFNGESDCSYIRKRQDDFSRIANAPMKKRQSKKINRRAH